MQADSNLTVNSRLTRSDIRTLALSSLGGTLEFYDFVIYVFFAPIIGQLFFPGHSPSWLLQLQTYAIFAAGYLARPLGGVIMAHFGDLAGRKRMFTISILLMAVPTFLMGLLPDYAVLGIGAPALLLILRLLQGAAIGAEVPGAWVFVAEHVPNSKVGFACGTLTGGLTAGILLGSVIASVIHGLFSQAEILAYAWRIPFLIGGIFGLMAVYLRSYLQETPVFRQLEAQRQLASEWPLKQVLRSHKTAVLLSMLLTWVLTGGIVVVILMTPALLSQLFGIDPRSALLANCLAVACLSLGCVAAGALTDKIGNGPTLLLGSVLLFLACLLFYRHIGAHPEWLYPGYALLGFTVGAVSVVPCIMVRVFPAEIRFSGLSFAYNVAYALFGGLTPVAVALMLRNDVQAPAHYMLALCVLSILLALLLCFTQARRRHTREPATERIGI